MFSRQGDSRPEEASGAVGNLDANKKNHILQDKHNWNKLVPNPKDPNKWKEVAGIISAVMANGTEEKYKSAENVFIKTYEVGGEVVQVVYKMIEGVVHISDSG